MRMGLHRHTGSRDDWLRRYVAEVRPPFVKFLDAFPRDLADHCHAHGTRIVGRVYFDRQELGAAGGRQVRQVVETARNNPHVDYWELFNEQFQGGPELGRYAELCIEFMAAMEALGKKAAIGCFSTGQPQLEERGPDGRVTRPSEWVRFALALRRAADGGHAVAVHEYGGGPVGMKWGVGRNQWNNGAPVTDDPCDDAGTRYLGWWCLRYRRAVDEWRRLGLATPDIIITEGGIDDIQPRGGPQGKGWRDFKGQHAPHVGDYAAQWAWYCRELARDRYVIGAVDFGWATADPAWNSFDLSAEPAMFDRMIAEMKAIPPGGPAMPPPPPVPPADSLATLLSARLGGRFSDLRTALPRHPSRVYGRLDSARLVGIAVHHSASPVDTTPEAIARHHVDGNGWAGIGYHFVIRRGHVYYVGALDTARAHVADRNHELVGICVTGDYTTADVAPEDATALRDLIAALDAHYGRALPVDGHLGWATAGHGTACPGRLLVVARSIRPTAPAGPDMAALRAAAAAEHEARGITLNPTAALQRAIRADGLTPTTREVDYADASGEYVWQRAEGLAGGGAMIYFVRRSEWHAVKRIPA